MLMDVDIWRYKMIEPRPYDLKHRMSKYRHMLPVALIVFLLTVGSGNWYPADIHATRRHRLHSDGRGDIRRLGELERDESRLLLLCHHLDDWFRRRSARSRGRYPQQGRRPPSGHRQHIHCAWARHCRHGIQSHTGLDDVFITDHISGLGRAIHVDRSTCFGQ